MNISIEPILIEQKSVFIQMMELYNYDFSEFSDDDINEYGYFGYPRIDDYWNEEGRYPFFIRVDGKLAGLDSGTYYLKETEAPAGYRPILDPIKLVLSPNFPEDLNSYVKGEGAQDSVLNLSAIAKTKVYVNGEYREKEVPLEVDQERGSLNLSVVNDIGKKLPITGSYVVPVLMGIGVTMVLVSFKNKQKDHE